MAKSKGRSLEDREILAALFRSRVEEAEGPQTDSRWRQFSFDEERLSIELRELAKLAGKRVALKRLKAFAAEFSKRMRLRISRSDPVDLPVPVDDLKLSRPLVGTALGALGADLFPTRRRAHRLAMGAARDLAYFGYGRLSDQVLPHPADLVRGALAGEDSLYVQPVLLDEAGHSMHRRWSIFDLVQADPHMHRDLDGEGELARFQQRLREDPLDGTMVSRLRAFFSRRATIGLRDTGRWALGSRHPWFGWERARELLAHCLERWGTENFISPQVAFYLPDLEQDQEELETAEAHNHALVELFAKRLAGKVPAGMVEKLGPEGLAQIADAALDCHLDLPDFDLERAERIGGETALRFASHVVGAVGKEFMGQGIAKARNFNLQAHFVAKGMEGRWLDGFDDDDKQRLYTALLELLKDHDAAGGLKDETGQMLSYRRPIHRIYTFVASPEPMPRADEQVLDSFDLSELKLPQHAHLLQAHPEIFEKLVVFFVLVMRLHQDTGHLPDLKPPKALRDFWLLGLWGTQTRNLVVHLFAHRDTGKVRSEIRLVAAEQHRALEPEDPLLEEAAVTRLASARLNSVLTVGLLRALGTFAMAAEESDQGTRVQALGTVAFVRQSLEVFRETARTGIKGSLVDLATALEVIVDASVDAAQRGLDRMASLSRSDE